VGINYGSCPKETKDKRTTDQWEVFYPEEYINSIQVGFTRMNSKQMRLVAFLLSTSSRRVFRSQSRECKPHVIKHWIAPKGHEIAGVIVKPDMSFWPVDISIRPVEKSNSNYTWEEFLQLEEEGLDEKDKRDETEWFKEFTKRQPAIHSKLAFNKDELLSDCHSRTNSLSEGRQLQNTRFERFQDRDEMSDDLISLPSLGDALFRNQSISSIEEEQEQEPSPYESQTNLDDLNFHLKVDERAAESKLKDALEYGYAEIAQHGGAFLFYKQWIYLLDRHTTKIKSIDHNIWKFDVEGEEKKRRGRRRKRRRRKRRRRVNWMIYFPF